MSFPLIEVKDQRLLKVDIGGTDTLSNNLLIKLEDALDQAEDLDRKTAILIHLVGVKDLTTLRSWPGPSDTQTVSKWERALRRVERSSRTAVVLVEHACSAIALELLLVADRRIASSGFLMRSTTHGESLWPGMALYRLTRQIGEARARKAFLDAADISATLALQLDIVDEIVDNFESGLAHIEGLLTNAPLEDFAIRRRLMQDSASTTFDDALGLHLAACDRRLRHSSSESLELKAAQTSLSTL
jgi:isomerase DpgB